MEITLRDKNYTAEHLTDVNYLPLGSLFVGEDGHFYLEDVDDYESLPQQTKNKLVQPLMKRLSDPDEKAAIAHSLSAIFPSLSRELVRYSGKHDFAMNLTLQELLTVAIAVGNALNPQEKPKPEELARAANIARLEEELAQAKSGRGFGK